MRLLPSGVDSKVHSFVDALGEHGAAFSLCEAYRYALWHIWDPKLVLVWVMCNPSTATQWRPDATIRKCLGFARFWGYGGIYVVNICALRSRDPKALMGGCVQLDLQAARQRAIGPDNAAYVEAALAGGADVVLGWGDALPRELRAAAKALLPSDRAYACLGITKSGQPRHPLMPSYATSLQSWA